MNFKGVSVVFVAIMACVFGQDTPERPVKICVIQDDYELCKEMELDVPNTWQCVSARDELDCARKIQLGEAELANLDPRAVYISGKYFQGVPIAAELVDGHAHLYEGVTLVRTDTSISSLEDLEGRRSCHTGVVRTVGWQLPVGILMAKGIMQPDCEEGELKAVETFFSGGSCAPGNWSNDPVVDTALKQRYRGLCSQCTDPKSCSSSDGYAGYEGSVRCLVDNAGDIAFTNIPVLLDMIKKDSSLTQNLQLLCDDGSKRPLTSNQEDMCTWGYRPSNAYVTSESALDNNLELLVSALLRTMALNNVPQRQNPQWYNKVFLSHPRATGVHIILRSEDDDYRTYLNDFINVIDKPVDGCAVEPSRVSYCVTSEDARIKCEDYSKAAESRGLSPGIDCVMTLSKPACMEALRMGYADLVTLDGGDVYKAGRYFGLQPVAAEVYGDLDASYYAVAVIRSTSGVNRLSELRNRRSCHTGIGRTAGWIVPVGSLIQSGDLNSYECNRAAAVANFFSAGSCVPGANDTKYNPGKVESKKLCQQCIGDENGRFKCARDSRERYSGYAGAFRCLAEGRGDVAFVKHTTVSENTNSRGSKQPWSSKLLSSDFKLLCGQGGTAPVDQYKECNLAKVPSHYVMTNAYATPLKRLQLAHLLADSSRFFSDESRLFRLFEKYDKDKADLLFKDSATGLKAAPLSDTYFDALGKDFFIASAAVDPNACTYS